MDCGVDPLESEQLQSNKLKVSDENPAREQNVVSRDLEHDYKPIDNSQTRLQMKQWHRTKAHTLTASKQTPNYIGVLDLARWLRPNLSVKPNERDISGNVECTKLRRKKEWRRRHCERHIKLIWFTCCIGRHVCGIVFVDVGSVCVPSSVRKREGDVCHYVHLFTPHSTHKQQTKYENRNICSSWK